MLHAISPRMHSISMMPEAACGVAALLPGASFLPELAGFAGSLPYPSNPKPLGLCTPRWWPPMLGRGTTPKFTAAQLGSDSQASFCGWRSKDSGLGSPRILWVGHSTADLN